MPVWDVLGKRRADDDFELVGGIKAPDVQMALILARETHFRHKEGVAYAVRLRGDDVLHAGPYEGQVLGGVTDHSYRRQEAYAGVGARHKRVGKRVAEQGLVIDRPRPPVGRSPIGERADPRGARPQAIHELTPEEIASQGAAG
jgi:1,2-phenylacetyl-CoA epoxidase PaaB subunit